MIYVRTPTDAELQELKRMTRQEIGRVGQRAQMILLSAQQRSVPEIAVNERGIPLRGHNIFWGIPNRVQDWLKKLPDEELLHLDVLRPEVDVVFPGENLEGRIDPMAFFGHDAHCPAPVPRPVFEVLPAGAMA